MANSQPGILDPLPQHAIFLEFELVDQSHAKPALAILSELPIDASLVVGLGKGFVSALSKSVNGLRAFPALTGPDCVVPSSQAGLWVWLRGKDRGVLFHQMRKIVKMFDGLLELERTIQCFKYRDGDDLSGYEDGTENPKEDDAVKAAIVGPWGGVLEGSSFVAAQNWQHDFEALEEMTVQQSDDIIGRRLADNEEFDEAPESAHVKRTAQESFEPEAFVVRRSMPWHNELDGGFMFVAFGATLDAFEAQLRRMAGLDDGIVDGLFKFTTPFTGSYFWCPALTDNGFLDLSVLK